MEPYYQDDAVTIYMDIAQARIAWWAEHPDGMTLVRRLEAEQECKARSDAGQLGLLGEAA